MSNPTASKKVLGRGLSALLQSDETDLAEKKAPANQAGMVMNIALNLIEVNPFQPRTTFEEEPLNDLADSIRVHGVLQPITVRKNSGNKYELIAGERRLRASKIAGKMEIPAYVRVASDQESIEIALIENIQREDLNPLEIAINYKRLMDECELTQDQLSERLGKNRSTIANFLRILRLPPDIQTGLRDQKISMGHAKALLAIDGDLPTLLSTFNEVAGKNLSVRQTEKMVKNIVAKPPRQSKSAAKNVDNSLRKMEDQLSSALGTRVLINSLKGGKGEIIIKFFSDEDLERLIELLGKE